MGKQRVEASEKMNSVWDVLSVRYLQDIPSDCNKKLHIKVWGRTVSEINRFGR